MTHHTKSGRLLPGVLLRVLPIAAIAMLLIGIATKVTVERSFLQQMRSNLEQDARFGADVTASKLNAILQSIRGVATNDLVINGLIDIETREAHVPLYFNQLQVAGLGSGERISFTDYRGRRIASNSSEGNFVGAPWLQELIEERKEHVRIDSRGATFSVPVVYQGLAEGAIVVELGKPELAKLLSVSLGNHAVLIGNSRGKIFSSDLSFADRYQIEGAEMADWLLSVTSIPGYDLKVVVAASRDTALASIKPIEWSLYLAFAFALVALIVGTFFVAYLTTNPLSKFTKELKKIGVARDLNHRVPTEGAAELRGLAESFNAMLDRLKQTVVSHEQLAAEVKIRQGAEVALKEQNERFNVALENMSHGVCVFDKQSQLVVSNDRYATMYGLSDKSVKPGLTSREIAEMRIAKGIYSGESPEEYIEDRVTWGLGCDDTNAKTQELSDGRTIRISRELLSDGGWVTTHEDITEIKRMERLERKQNERFSVALENMSQGLSVFDSRQKLVVCNERYATMYGLSLEQVKPGTLLNDIIQQRILNGFYSGESPEKYIEERHLWASDSRKKEKIQEFSDGRTIRVSREQLSDGGWVATHEDITESMRMERLKNEFVSVVSHELRTPLTSLSGSLSLLNSDAVGSLPDKAKSLLGIADRNTKRLAVLVDDILDIEKIRSDKMELEFTATDVVALAQCAIIENAAYGVENSVTFRLDERVGSAYTEIDESRIMQVFANLLSNSAKFSSPNSEVVIQITRESGYLRCAVIDHGCGIPEEKKPELFERFFQVDASDSRSKRGTGLGLSIVKAIVEIHGSHIHVDSQVGKGSTFYFDLEEVASPHEVIRQDADLAGAVA